MLPFPPRVFAKEYLALNPLGTIPFMIDGETKMTESSGICHYLGTRYGPTPLIVGVDDPAYGAFLNWMYFSDATLTFPQTLVLRYTQLEPEERRNPQVAADYAKWFLGRLRAVEAATAQGGDAVRRSVHRGRYRDRLRAAACRKYRACKGFRTQRRRLLATPAAARRLQEGGRRGRSSPASQQKWLPDACLKPKVGSSIPEQCGGTGPRNLIVQCGIAPFGVRCFALLRERRYRLIEHCGRKELRPGGTDHE